MIATNAQESLEAYEKYFLVDQGELDDIQQQKLEDKDRLGIEEVKPEFNENFQTIQRQDSIDNNDLAELGSIDDPGIRYFGC